MFKKILYVLLSLAISFGFYYFTLPAFNIHSAGFWFYIIEVLAIWLILWIMFFFHIFSYKSEEIPIRKKARKKSKNWAATIVMAIIFLPMIISILPNIALPIILVFAIYFAFKLAHNSPSKLKFIVTSFIMLFILFLASGILSSPIFNSKAYRDVADITNKGTLSDAFSPIDSVSELDILTMQSSSRVGDRTLGQMAQKYISQFEVNNEYNLIHINDNPIRVTPLEYGDFFKWLNNKSDGIPAYLSVDITSQTSALEELNDKPIKYAPSAFFGENLMRHLRFNHPTVIFGKPQFELSDDGYPYYIVPTKTANAGLWGALAVNGAVLCNATTGETSYYDINSVPTWVDHVYSVDDINQMAQWHYNYVHGYFNFSKKDMRNTSFHYDNNQYNTIARDGDIFMSTGITSVGTDESNVGFIMSNLRTGKIDYYSDPGAEESSAQGSAEGLVQQFGYRASPPKLVNIDGISTYYMPLYDSQGLFRKYAFVSKSNFTIATEADTLQEAFDKYRKLIKPAIPISTYAKIGIIAEIYSATVDGNTYYYFTLNDDTNFYISSINNNPKQVQLKIGNTVNLEYVYDNNSNAIVKSIQQQDN